MAITALTTISGEIQSQPLNDNFSHIAVEFNASFVLFPINIADLGAKSEDVDPSFDNQTIIQAAIDSLTNGGVVTMPQNKVYITDFIRLKNNVTLDLNGSTLKLINNAADLHHLVTVPQTTQATNIGVRNGKLNGNKANQTLTNGKSGIYFINVDGVEIKDLEVYDCDGEGVFLGYTGYLCENVNMDILDLHGNTRNDLVLGNVDTINGENIKITSLGSSASIDFELHDAADIIKNVNLDKVQVNSSTNNMKLISNGYTTNTTDNITLSNFKFTGTKGLAISEFDNVRLENIEGYIDVAGSKNIKFDGLDLTNAAGNGLYIYPSVTPRTSDNIFIDNAKITACSNVGLILQGVKTAQVNNVSSYDNSSSGILIAFDCDKIHMVNVNSTDTRSGGSKTQTYGVEFQGTNTNINLIDVYTEGNLTSNYLNLPANAFILTRNRLQFITPDGANSHALIYDNNLQLLFGAFMGAKRLQITQQYATGSVTLNGSIFEDSADSKLKYINLAGVVQTLSN